MFGDVATPIRGLLVALAGALLAYLWYEDQDVLGLDHRLVAGVLAVVVCLVGLGLNWIGTQLLPDHPRPALWFLEGWVLAPAAIAAVAAAIVVIVTVALTVPDTTATSTKETIGALSTGLTGFITAAFISWTGESDDSKVSDHIRSAFWAKYQREPTSGTCPAGVHCFRAESSGERLVYSTEYEGIEGWNQSARRARAKGISEELKNRNSEPVTA